MNLPEGSGQAEVGVGGDNTISPALLGIDPLWGLLKKLRCTRI